MDNTQIVAVLQSLADADRDIQRPVPAQWTGTRENRTNSPAFQILGYEVWPVIVRNSRAQDLQDVGVIKRFRKSGLFPEKRSGLLVICIEQLEHRRLTRIRIFGKENRG
jgi:hypothetical protein